MDILNWLYLAKNKFIKTTVQDNDLLVVGTNVGFSKRGDKYQNYGVTAEDFAAYINSQGGGTYKSTVLWIFEKTGAININQILANEIGGTWSGTYVSTGEYILENSDVSISFSNSNTAIFYTASGTIAGDVTFINNNDNTISINSFNSAGTLADGGIFRGYLEIRQYTNA